MALEAVIFDMGDVLFDATAWGRWLRGVVRQLGFDAEYGEFYRAWDERFLPDVHLGRRPYREAFRQFLVFRGLSALQIEEVESAALARKRQFESQRRPFPGVRKTLSALAEQGARLGVLSDSELPSAELAALLHRMSLASFFVSILSSRDIGHCKPDRETYEASLAELRCSPEAAGFVGHDAGELAGAARLGMHTIAFNFEPDTLADQYARRFSDIARIVSELGALAGTCAGGG